MEAIRYEQLCKLIPLDTLYDRREDNPRMQSVIAAFMRLNGYHTGSNPHNVRAWGIYNEFGLLCIAIGSHESEALDNAADVDAMDIYHVPYDELDDEQQEQLQGCNGVDDLTPLGNASELFDLQFVTMRALT